jgi:hypothetical protein
VTPVVDPDTISSPDVTTEDLEIIVDVNAAEPGIQSGREVERGDVIRVAVVIANAPEHVNFIGGVSTLQFNLWYDKRVLVAPTIAGGSSVDRNPDLNQEALGGEEAGWQCLPAPEGDRADPGGVDGDGLPETGQALLSCFTPSTGTESGTIVMAVVEFHAVGTGETTLVLEETSITDTIGIAYANCEGDPLEPWVPCREGKVTVK